MDPWVVSRDPCHSCSLLTLLFKTGEPRAALLLHFTTGAHFLLSKASSAGRFLPHPAGASLFSTERRSRRMALGLRKHIRSPGGWTPPCPQAPKELSHLLAQKSGILSAGWLYLLVTLVPGADRPLPWNNVLPQCCPRTCSCFPVTNNTIPVSACPFLLNR